MLAYVHDIKALLSSCSLKNHLKKLFIFLNLTANRFMWESFCSLSNTLYTSKWVVDSCVVQNARVATICENRNKCFTKWMSAKDKKMGSVASSKSTNVSYMRLACWCRGVKGPSRIDNGCKGLVVTCGSRVQTVLYKSCSPSWFFFSPPQTFKGFSIQIYPLLRNVGTYPLRFANMKP